MKKSNVLKHSDLWGTSERFSNKKVSYNQATTFKNAVRNDGVFLMVNM